MTRAGRAGGKRRRRAAHLSDDEMDRRVSAEILRSLSIANMVADALVAEVADRMLSEHLAEIPRARVRGVLLGLIVDGTVREFDAAQVDAVGVGCPCCTGGQDASAAAAAATAARPVLSAAGYRPGYPVSHAAYCLLDTWWGEYGIMDQPTLERFQKELCRRGNYEWGIASESVRRLIEWRMFASSDDGVISVEPAPGRRTPE